MIPSLKTNVVLLKNVASSIFGKVSGILIRLVQVPLLLHALGVEAYGQWLVISSLPVWLSISSLGFGSVAANEMSISVAANNLPKAIRIFSTATLLVLVIGIGGIAIIYGTSQWLPLSSILHVAANRHSELAMAIFYLSISVFVSFVGEIFDGRFRAARKAHQAVLWFSFRPWLDLLLLIIVLQFSHSFDCLALAMLLSTCIYVAIIGWQSALAMPILRLKWHRPLMSDIRFLLGKGLAFQAFPLGNAFLFQASLLVVQGVLGPAAVALFSTARTLVRTVNQAMEIVNQTLWPELSLLFGANQWKQAAQLHRFGVMASFTIAIGCSVFLAFAGQTLYAFWTGNVLQISQQLLLLFLLPIPFNALWFTSSVVHIASNQHEGLAVRYLIACTLSMAACWLFSTYFGLAGAAFSTVIGDLVLIPYVFKHSLRLTQDNLSNCLQSIPSDIAQAFSRMKHLLRKKR